MNKYAFFAPIPISNEERDKLTGTLKEFGNQLTGKATGIAVGVPTGLAAGRAVQLIAGKAKTSKPIMDVLRGIRADRLGNIIDTGVEKLILNATGKKPEISGDLIKNFARNKFVRKFFEKHPSKKALGLAVAAGIGGLIGDAIGNHTAIRKMEEKNNLEPRSEVDLAMRKAIDYAIPFNGGEVLAYYALNKIKEMKKKNTGGVEDD